MTNQKIWLGITGVLSFSLAVGISVGEDDCTWTCEENPTCAQADVDCPGCDEPGFNTCSDVVFHDYNPSGDYIERAVAGGDQKFEVQDTRICDSFQSCAEGTVRFFEVCLGAGGACVGGSLPGWCQPCVKVGAPTNQTVDDVKCVDCET